jgi:hypothetical protein
MAMSRRQAARIGALARLVKHGPDGVAAPLKGAWRASLGRRIDADYPGLSSEEREQRVDALMQIEMIERALRSVEKRRRQHAGREAALRRWAS